MLKDAAKIKLDVLSIRGKVSTLIGELKKESFDMISAKAEIKLNELSDALEEKLKDLEPFSNTYLLTDVKDLKKGTTQSRLASELKTFIQVEPSLRALEQQYNKIAKGQRTMAVT